MNHIRFIRFKNFPDRLSEERKTEEQVEREQEKNRVDRIDIVALEERSRGSIAIVFYEIKTFDDPRLRARVEENPEVVSKLEDYEDLIAQAKKEIVAGYRQVCEDLITIGRSVAKPGKINELIKEAAKDTNLEVDTKPRLVIVDYTDSQWTDLGWQHHLEKLQAAGFPVKWWANPGKVSLLPADWA